MHSKLENVDPIDADYESFGLSRPAKRDDVTIREDCRFLANRLETCSRASEAISPTLERARSRHLGIAWKQEAR